MGHAGLVPPADNFPQCGNFPRKTDPGAKFPWATFRQMAASCARMPCNGNVRIGRYKGTWREVDEGEIDTGTTAGWALGFIRKTSVAGTADIQVPPFRSDIFPLTGRAFSKSYAVTTGDTRTTATVKGSSGARITGTYKYHSTFPTGHEDGSGTFDLGCGP